MGKNSKEKKSVMKSVGEFTDLINSSVMQICGDREITVDGCKGIVEYLDNEIKIKTCEGGVSIFGRNLNIKYLSINSIVVEGKIRGVEFSSPTSST